MQGDRERMREAFDKARTKTKVPQYALRHWILSSTEMMTIEQVMQSVKKLADEFGFNEEDANIIMHQKARDGEDISNQHYHIAVPEVLENGRVMTNQKNYAKHEKICRELEHEFGFSHIVGKHNKAVQYATADLNPEVSEVAKELAKEPLPNARYSSKKYQEAKRSDIDIKRLTKLAKEQCTDINSFEKIKARLDSLGLKIQEGTHKRKNGSLTPVIATQDGFVLGSVGGILKRNAQEVSDISEALQKDREGMHVEQEIKAVEAPKIVPATPTPTETTTAPERHHGGMREPTSMTWEEKLNQEMQKLEQIYNAPHPELVEESAMSKAERAKNSISQQVNEMNKLKEQYNKLKEERNELIKNKSMFNNNQKKSEAVDEKMQEMFEKIARLSAYMAMLILHKLGLSGPPDEQMIFTDLERNEILKNYKEHELTNVMTKQKEIREKGIYKVAEIATNKINDQIEEWRNRPEAEEAIKKYGIINRLINFIKDEDGELTTEQKEKLVELSKAGKIEEAHEFQTDINLEKYRRGMQEEAENEQEQDYEQEPAQEQRQRPKNSMSLGM
ncbi:relaxase/mobilization nuclease domain-containing protein [Gluconobacter sphaericus]|uniref:relaxase/mobilization nuclease domain-containing protein n=1 Tax=Gluconobacter sphaericus TaxID=574987 RepID=UPI0038D020F9